MISVTELNVRGIEHKRCVALANQHGWLLESIRRDRRTSTLGAVFTAVSARLSWRRSARTVGGAAIGGTDPAVGICA
jgi:hypothetical protein